MSIDVPPKSTSRFSFLLSWCATRISECVTPPTIKTMMRLACRMKGPTDFKHVTVVKHSIPCCWLQSTLGVRPPFADLLPNAFFAQVTVLSRLLRTETAFMPAGASARNVSNCMSAACQLHAKSRSGTQQICTRHCSICRASHAVLSGCSYTQRPLAWFDICLWRCDADIFRLRQLSVNQVLDHISQQWNKSLQSELLLCLVLFSLLHSGD